MSLHALAERRIGGRVHGYFYLLHPGPSVLVAVVFVALASLAAHAVPSPPRVLQLVLLMLPMQFAIGAVNDLADVRTDAMSKPYKPLVRGAVAPRVASGSAALLLACSFAAAASIGVSTLGFAAGGAAAGLTYDLALRQTPLSLLPWWMGMLMVVLIAFAAADALSARLWAAVPLTLLIALSLHCANALPDIDDDRRAKRRSLPVLLGKRSSLAIALAGVLLAALVAQVVGVGSRPVLLLRVAGAVASITVLLAATLWRERPFPVLACGVAVLAVAWLANVVA